MIINKEFESSCKADALSDSELEQASGGTYFPAVPVTPFGETTTAVICPHCMKAVKGTVEQINAHIAACRG